MKTTTMPHHTECIDLCNSLLRGELSAIETYALAIDKFPQSRHLSVLKRIRDEHTASANRLRQNIQSMGGDPDTDSGVWGDFAKGVQTAADFLGKKSAVQSLIQGEEHGESEYQEALESDEMMLECKDMVRKELLPRIQQHIVTLKSLQA